MDIIIYDNRSFSKILDLKLKIKNKLSNFKFNFQFNSILSNKLKPIIAVTCYKGKPYDSIYQMAPDRRKREIQLMNKLKSLHKNVPVIRAKFFNNACYIPGLDSILNSSSDRVKDALIKTMCDEWGIDESEFRSSIGPHMIILGDSFCNAPTLAHEFGHYLNTIGEGEPKGDVYHSKLASSKKRSALLTGISIITNKLAIIPTTARVASSSVSHLINIPASTSATIAAILFAISSASRITSIFTSRYIIKSETVASLTGIKLLKIVGASDDELKLYDDDLVSALDSYKSYYVKSPLKRSISSGIASAIMISHI